MTPERILQSMLAFAVAVIGYFLADIHGQIKDVQRAHLDIVVAQQHFVTRDMLDRSVKEMRDDVTAQIRSLREDMPGIIRSALIREQTRRER